MAFNQMVHSLNDIKSKYNVADIISKLESFLEAHKEDYKKAVEVYQKDMTSKLKELNKLAYKGEFGKIQIQQNLGLITPVNCESSYNKIITVFKAMKETEIELSFDDANHVFNDSWDFISTAKTTNSFYSSRG